MYVIYAHILAFRGLLVDFVGKGLVKYLKTYPEIWIGNELFDFKINKYKAFQIKMDHLVG